MKDLINLIWIKFDLGRHDACHDTESIFLEINGKYFRLTPTEVSMEEYDRAWYHGEKPDVSDV